MNNKRKKIDPEIVESPTVKFLSKLREIADKRKKVDQRLDAIVSERLKAVAIRAELISQSDKLCNSRVELKNHRQDTAKEKTEELISRDDITPRGAVEGVIKLKAVEQKIFHITDNIEKLNGGIEATNKRIRKLDSEKTSLSKREAHLINLERLLGFIDNFYRWAEVNKESENLFLEAQAAAIEMKGQGFKIAPALKELGIIDELVQQVLGCSWILKDNPIEALQQVARPNITSNPELNPFYDFGGRKRRVRGNNLTSDFRADHLGMGFSHMAADLDRAREATFNR